MYSLICDNLAKAVYINIAYLTNMQTDSSDIKRFLLIDDHTIIRSALKSHCLSAYPGSIIEESADGKGIMELLGLHFYDLVIMDIQIPNCETLWLITSMSLNFPKVPVLVYSMTAANIYALRVMKAGARGFVSKDASLKELETAIGLTLQGRMYVCEEIEEKLIDQSVSRPTTPFSKLSARQIQIAALLLSGHTVTDISRLLSIGVSTVGTHKGKIFEKLSVDNLLELKLVSDIYKF
jgi:two-component system invasion response regulator UvrY